MEDQTCRHFSLSEIQSATQDFNEELIIGRGGFGKVYKGQISSVSATNVAIKQLHSMSDQGPSEFWAEVELLSKLRHCNLVSLIGYCDEGKEMVLVYEYMPHGTLEDHLHKGGVFLSWLQRLKICIGAARGIDYLHNGTGTQQGIIHRDVKSSNILLDENFAAKVSDFGLAKIGPINQTRTHVSTGVKGTFGYMDPCYFYTGQLTRKSDVYSFGVILLEVLCGRRAVDPSLDEEQWSLATWAQDRIKEGKLNRIIDFRLRDQISNNCLKQFARLACRCLHSQPKQRPTMAETVVSLEAILSLQERVDSSVTEGNFVNKLWSFFPRKVQLKTSKVMSANTVNIEGEPSKKATSKVMSANTVNIEGEPSKKATDGLIHFDASLYTLEQLVRATGLRITMNSYSTTCLVYMENGELLLVKRLKNYMPTKKDILEKIHVIGKLDHGNIFLIKAFYYGKDAALFIYDHPIHTRYQDIATFLHLSESEGLGPRHWPVRLSIIVGITRGLVYIHTQNVVHGYLMSKNVLVDEHFTPLIADVGLAMLTDNTIAESPLYRAPELLKFEDANMKTDVYGLGLIMIELLTGKSTDSGKDGLSFPAWVMCIQSEDLIAEMFDPQLLKEGSNIQLELLAMLQIAMACISPSNDARPKAGDVLHQVEEIVAMSEKW